MTEPSKSSAKLSTLCDELFRFHGSKTTSIFLLFFCFLCSCNPCLKPGTKHIKILGLRNASSTHAFLKKPLGISVSRGKGQNSTRFETSEKKNSEKKKEKNMNTRANMKNLLFFSIGCRSSFIAFIPHEQGFRIPGF